MKQEPTIFGKRRRNFYLPDQLMAEVGAIAETQQVSVTEVLRKALELYVRAWKEKHGTKS